MKIRSSDPVSIIYTLKTSMVPGDEIVHRTEEDESPSCSKCRDCFQHNFPRAFQSLFQFRLAESWSPVSPQFIAHNEEVADFYVSIDAQCIHGRRFHIYA